jgi:hypothetical protein
MSYNKENCNKWHNNPLINPLSNRPIKKDGPIYKILEKECANILKFSPKKIVKVNKKPIYNTDNCNKWHSNHLINPLSNRPIKKDGPIYKKFQIECDNILKLSPKNKSSNNDIDLCKKWINNKLINPKTNKSIKLNGPLYKQYLLKCAKLLKSSSSSSLVSANTHISSSSTNKKSKLSSSLVSANTHISSSSTNKKSKLSSSLVSANTHISSSLKFKIPSSGNGSSKKYLKSNKEGSFGSITDIFSTPRLKSKSLLSSQYNTALTRSFKSTPFSKSSTKYSIETANESFKINSSNDIILAFIEKRINNYNILNKYISKINTKYSNNCIKKYKNISERQLLRIGNKIILKKKLGQSGGYGIVYKGYYRANKRDDYNYNIKFAVKICEITENNKKEIEIAKILTDKVINEDFANYPILYGYLKCNSDELYDLYSSENSSGSLNYSPQSLFSNNYNSLLNKNQLYFQIYEIAYGTLNNYFAYIIDDDTNKIKSNEFVFNALAQVFISLICFYCHTDMCHADTHFGNFLYHKITPGGKPFEYNIFNYNLSIENIGYLWVINDFGLAEKFIDGKIISQILKDFKLIIQELLSKKSYFIDDKINNFIKKINDYLDIDLYLIDDFETLLINIINCLLEYSETFKLIV